MSGTSDDGTDVEPASPFTSAPHDTGQAGTGASNDERATVENDDTASHDEDLSDRENLFHGPDSTWRSYTENERNLAASLDQLQAGDISIHLYNVHALKARLRDPNAVINAKPQHSKKTWIKRNEDGSLPWYPRDVWTAWPLSSEDVPRTGERFGVSLPDQSHPLPGSYSKDEQWRPSGEMEQAVLALMLRKIKDKHIKEAVNHSRAIASATAKAKFIKDESKEVELRGVDRASDASDNESPQDGNLGSEASFHADQSVFLPSANYFQPGILEDDDEAFELLQPEIHHILSKLDDLLYGLHRGRKGHKASKGDGSRSRSRNASSRSTSTRPASRQSIQEDESDEQDEAHDSHKPKRRKKVDLRDWSEVMNVASLVGWDHSIVERSVHRCANLFNENVDYGRIADDAVPTPIVPSNKHPTNVPPRAESPEHDSFIIKDDAEAKWVYCPVATCKRKDEPFSQVWRWREHLKRVHKYDRAGIERAEITLQSHRRP
jgi:hypothetical protein